MMTAAELLELVTLETAAQAEVEVHPVLPPTTRWRYRHAKELAQAYAQKLALASEEERAEHAIRVGLVKRPPAPPAPPEVPPHIGAILAKLRTAP
jgi:hypothetical protein